MKKIIYILIIFAMVGILTKVVNVFIVGKHNIVYELEQENHTFYIKETFMASAKTVNRYEQDKPNYFFEVKLEREGDPLFVFKIINPHTRYQRLIKDIKYYEDSNIKCIYPIFRNRRLSIDVLCLLDDSFINYTTISGHNKELDLFVNDLEKNYHYQYLNWAHMESSFYNMNDIDIATNNIVDKHTIVLWNYDGIITIKKDDIREITLLIRTTNYENKLGVLVDKYYVVPNYDRQFSYNRFIIVDVAIGSKKDATLVDDVSYDSYIQGVVDKKLYIYDRDNKYQYEVDPKRATAIKVGDVDSGIKHYNGKWQNISISEANTSKLFTREFVIPPYYQNKGYEKIDSVLGDTDGYYYLYKKINNQINVYRANKQRPEYITYLFTTNEMSNIKYINDYIYFINKDTIYVYHDRFKLKPVIKHFELFFNTSNIYDVYSKE
ncbi:MAG: hypothetical protein PHF47_02445 [Bacilli bacterium]|nr:hypothetical protein [Bacilli bacterium]